jgi:peptide/nickel transport system permease protein
MRFLLRRFAFYVFTAWAALTINFFIPRMIPGDPVKSMLSRFQGQMSTDAIHSLYVLFGIDQHASIWKQYLDYWRQLLHGDLGLSFTAFPSPVSEVIGGAVWWTVILVGLTTIVSSACSPAGGGAPGWTGCYR